MKMFQQRSTLATVAVALLAATGLALSGCSTSPGSGSSAAPESNAPHIGTISLGVVSDATTAPLVVAAQQGLFEKYGLTPDIKIFASGSAASQAVAAGDVDLTASGQFAVVTGAAAGTNVDVLARMSVADKQVGVVANSSVTSVKDLAGKNVGVQFGSTAQLYAILLEQQSGISFNLVNIGNDQLIAAFAKGQADAFISWQPNLDLGSQAVKGAHVIAYSGDDGVMPLVTYLVSSDKFAQNTAAVDAAVKAIGDATDWSSKNADQLTQLLAKQFNVSQDTVAGSVNVFNFEFGWSADDEKALKDAAGVASQQQGTSVDIDKILKISVPQS